MDLVGIITNAVDLAFSIIDPVLEKDVEWTFTTSDTVDFDVEQDAITGETDMREIDILLYSEQTNDTGGSFSSTGRFLDSPVERYDATFMMESAQFAPLEPTVNDFFVTKKGQRYIVRTVELIPTRACWIGKCSKS